MHAQGKIGDMSATGYPIHFMFGSRVGFFGSADHFVAICISIKFKMTAAAA